ncbi:MAG: RES family NAD+ phosphorylase [Terracidiphilus sp.]
MNDVGRGQGQMGEAVPKILWRISNHLDLSGEGGRKFNGRWHTSGSGIVYLAESPMAALVETLVHLNVDSEDTPDFYTLLKISVPEGLSVLTLDPPDGSEWKQDLELTRRMGDAWLASRETPLARVPSVIAPQTWNYLLNPEHPDAKQVKVEEVIREQFDNRLFRFGAR